MRRRGIGAEGPEAAGAPRAAGTERRGALRAAVLRAAVLRAGVLCAALFVAAPAARAAAASAGPAPTVVVVTTSMLEAATLELRPAIPGLRVVRLVPPAACPGHFDLSPRALEGLRAARLVLREEFEGALDGKLAASGVRGARVEAAGVGGSPLVPARYAALVAKVADRLGAVYPDRRAALDEAARATRARTEALGAALRREAAPLAGVAAVASQHQKDFLEFLGLKVVATLPRPDDATPRDLERLAAAPARVVVGGVQEGTQAAAAVAERTRAPMATLSAVPGAPGFGAGYDELLRANLAALERALGAR
ncbi:MAG: zinc ABC transporter substrate-binding protein [Candidatus Polarisedimenticolia bacterium]